jgi:hypothetical protein
MNFTREALGLLNIRKEKLLKSSLAFASYIKNESIEVLFHISACAFILTNPMLSGVTFHF